MENELATKLTKPVVGVLAELITVSYEVVDRCQRNHAHCTPSVRKLEIILANLERVIPGKPKIERANDV